MQAEFFSHLSSMLSRGDDGDDGGGLFSSFNSNRRSVFVCDLTCFPVSFCGKEELEYGNKIILPPTALQALARMNITWPMLFEVSHPTMPMKTHCGVLEFVSEEGSCYIPYWMMRNLCLAEGDIVRIRNISLRKGTFVKLQPLTLEFLEIKNPREVLESALSNYATLTVGDNIMIEYDYNTYPISIVELKPDEGVSIIETDVQVEFLPPLGYEEPTPTADKSEDTSKDSKKTSSKGSKKDSAEIPSQESKKSAGYRLDGKPVPIPAEELDELTSYETRLPRGVRQYNKKYSDLIARGRIPGIIGKNSNNRTINQPRK